MSHAFPRELLSNLFTQIWHSLYVPISLYLDNPGQLHVCHSNDFSRPPPPQRSFGAFSPSLLAYLIPISGQSPVCDRCIGIHVRTDPCTEHTFWKIVLWGHRIRKLRSDPWQPMAKKMPYYRPSKCTKESCIKVPWVETGCKIAILKYNVITSHVIQWVLSWSK